MGKCQLSTLPQLICDRFGKKKNQQNTFLLIQFSWLLRFTSSLVDSAWGILYLQKVKQIRKIKIEEPWFSDRQNDFSALQFRSSDGGMIKSTEHKDQDQEGDEKWRKQTVQQNKDGNYDDWSTPEQGLQQSGKQFGFSLLVITTSELLLWYAMS